MWGSSLVWGNSALCEEPNIKYNSVFNGNYMFYIRGFICIVCRACLRADVIYRGVRLWQLTFYLL